MGQSEGTAWSNMAQKADSATWCVEPVEKIIVITFITEILEQGLQTLINDMEHCTEIITICYYQYIYPSGTVATFCRWTFWRQGLTEFPHSDSFDFFKSSWYYNIIRMEQEV
jgi:hypothetical protein